MRIEQGEFARGTYGISVSKLRPGRDHSHDLSFWTLWASCITKMQ